MSAGDHQVETSRIIVKREKKREDGEEEEGRHT